MKSRSNPTVESLTIASASIDSREYVDFEACLVQACRPVWRCSDGSIVHIASWATLRETIALNYGLSSQRAQQLIDSARTHDIIESDVHRPSFRVRFLADGVMLRVGL